MPFNTVQGDGSSLGIEGRYPEFRDSAILTKSAWVTYDALSAPADSLRRMESLRTAFRNTCHVSPEVFFMHLQGSIQIIGGKRGEWKTAVFYISEVMGSGHIKLFWTPMKALYNAKPTFGMAAAEGCQSIEEIMSTVR